MHEHTDSLEQTGGDEKPASKPDPGVLVFKREMRNRRDEVVQEREATILYRCQEGGKADGR